MSCVFVVDTNRQPLNPVHPGRARHLLKQGKAAVLRLGHSEWASDWHQSPPLLAHPSQ